MTNEQELLDKVETKLNKQNALYAAIGAGLWTIPALVIWFFVSSYNPQMGPVMLLLNGFVIGSVVRIHGKGMKPLFSLLALVVHTWIVVVAFTLDMVLKGTTWAFFLFGLYVVGAYIAIRIARIEVPFEEHRAHSELTYMQAHKSNKKVKNKWFTAFAVLIFTLPISTYLASIGIGFFSEFQTQNKHFQRAENQQALLQNLEIDITHSGLEHKTTKDILNYSYAYHTGLLFNLRGTSSRIFPRSEYKAITILKYVVKNRDDARAKFILGLLVGGNKGSALLREAEEQGDKYAKVYSAIKFGCYSDSALAIKQLNVLRNRFRHGYIKEEIESILYVGFNDVCIDIEEPEYLLSYVLNYEESSR